MSAPTPRGEITVVETGPFASIPSHSLVGMYHADVGDDTSRQVVGVCLAHRIEDFLDEARLGANLREAARDEIIEAVFETDSSHHAGMCEDFAKACGARVSAAKRAIAVRRQRSSVFDPDLHDMADAHGASAIEIGALWRCAAVYDPVLARIITLRVEGWTIAEVAGAVCLSRQLVGDILEAAERGTF